MSYATIMVHLLTGQSNTAVLAVAAELARRHDARLIGIAATQPLPVMYNGFYDNSLSVAILHEDMAQETANAETEFRGAFAAAKHPAEWRSTWTCMALADYISGEARSADLIVTSPAVQTQFNSARRQHRRTDIACRLPGYRHPAFRRCRRVRSDRRRMEGYPRSAPRSARCTSIAQDGVKSNDRRDC